MSFEPAFGILFFALYTFTSSNSNFLTIMKAEICFKFNLITFSALLPRYLRLGLLLRWGFGDHSIVQQPQLIVPRMLVVDPRVRDHIQTGVRHVQMLVVSSIALGCCRG